MFDAETRRLAGFDAVTRPLAGVIGVSSVERVPPPDLIAGLFAKGTRVV
ncbi:hypothetical protein ACLBWX_04270 [Methylobacterium sp. M6A4_1b]